jgi:hypothetical protein
MEAFALARRHAYGLRPPPVDQRTYRLSPAYTAQAVRVVQPLPAALQSPDLVYMAGSPAAKMRPEPRPRSSASVSGGAGAAGSTTVLAIARNRMFESPQCNGNDK